MPRSPRVPVQSIQGLPFDTSAPGVILMSASHRILQMNHRARALLKMFGEAHDLRPDLGPECMPAMLTQFCRDLMSELDKRTSQLDGAQFELRRVCHMVTPPLLLRGFAMSASTDRQTRMILTLQPCAAPLDAPPAE